MSGYKSQRPADLTIIARAPEYTFENTMSENKYWYMNDPVSTHFVNAFQATFPEGERFFIEAAMDCIAKYGKKHVICKELASDFKLFVRQEAMHGHLHKRWTKELVRIGYVKMSEFDFKMLKYRKWLKSSMPPLARLAITAAAEHYTASLAYIFVHAKPGLVTKSLPPYNGLLLYHAMEEIEHKSVCFDLLSTFSKSYLLRIFGFLYITADLAVKIWKRFRYLLKSDGLWGGPHAKSARSFFLSKNGLLRILFPRLASYIKPGFHPWNTDERHTIEQKFGDIRRAMGIEAFCR